MRVLLIALLCIIYLGLYAQESTVASGGELQGVGGQASFSLGQLFYENTGGTYTEGLQLASEVSYISGEVIIVEHHSGLMLFCANKDKSWVSYQWYCNEEEISNLNYCFNANGLNGVYYLVTTDAEGNTFYSARYAYASNQTAEKSLSLYPVPVQQQEYLHVFYSNAQKTKRYEQLRIIDIQGKEVYSNRVEVGMPYTVDVSHLPLGVYTVLIDNVKRKILVR